MDTLVRSNRNSVSHCHYHVVFCPKYRRKVLVNGIDDRLKVLLREHVEKWGQELVECEVRPDHVHLLVGCDPQFGIHRLVKFVKGQPLTNSGRSIPFSNTSYPVCGRTVTT